MEGENIEGSEGSGYTKGDGSDDSDGSVAKDEEGSDIFAAGVGVDGCVRSGDGATSSMVDGVVPRSDVLDAGDGVSTENVGTEDGEEVVFVQIFTITSSLPYAILHSRGTPMFFFISSHFKFQNAPHPTRAAGGTLPR